jgi:hypothetical protein
MDWVPPEVDTRRANVARVYDYWLGGTHNFLPDQDAARAIAAVEPEGRPEVAQAIEKVYSRSVSAQGRIRSRAEILRFFDGFDLLDPGLVYMPQWRPDSPDDVLADPSRLWALVGVGRKA